MRVIWWRSSVGFVALAAAQLLEALLRHRAVRVVGATRLLLERARCTHAEARRLAHVRLAAHRHFAVLAVEHVRPQQHALAARAVGLAALQRIPDRLARAPVGVHGDQTAGHEERRLAFEVDHLERLHGDVVRVERDRLGAARLLGAEQAAR